MAVKIEVKTNSNSRVLRGLDKVAKIPPQFVKVGFIENVKMYRRESEETNPFLGYIHEHGVPSKGIPARPFLLPAMRTSADEAEAYIRKGLARSWIDPDEIARGLGYAGTAIRDEAKANIANAENMKPLSPKTIAIRQTPGYQGHKKGFFGTLPLNVSGQLKNAITYVVK